MTDEKEEAVHAARKELVNEFVRSAREGDGWPVEADSALNNASRRMVEALRAAHGEVWLGQINLHGDDRGKPERAMWKWDGSLVLNFSAAYVVPKYDEELLRLIMERDAAPYTSVAADVPRVDAINTRLEQVGGIQLVWT